MTLRGQCVQSNLPRSRPYPDAYGVKPGLDGGVERDRSPAMTVGLRPSYFATSARRSACGRAP
jgi:hypothetical protein